MDYQQAITEVGFIKKLLDNTGKELGQSGWSFILMGLVMLIQDAYVFFLSRFTQPLLQITMKLIASTELIIGIMVIFLITWIYRKYVAAKITLTLEKQLWQVWLWVIISEIGWAMVKSSSRILFLTQGNVSEYLYSVGTPLMAALLLLITGILTNRRFFYGTAIFVFMIVVSFEALFTGWDWWYYIPRSIFGLSPFFITGGYFLLQQSRAKTEASHGFTEPSGSL